MTLIPYSLSKNLAGVVANVATTGTAEHVRALVSHGVVEPLVDMLESEDARMLLVVMDAIAAILAVGKKLSSAGSPNDFEELFDEVGLPGRLEELQSHPQEDVYARAVAIVESYYNNCAADEDESCAPVQPALGFGGPTAFSFTGQPPGAQTAHFSSHGIGGGVAPVQLFASPTVQLQSAGGGLANSHLLSSALSAPTQPVFAFDSVTFV
jgi:hypothetical protein